MKCVMCFIVVLLMQAIVNADIIFSREYSQDVWPTLLNDSTSTNLPVCTNIEQLSLEREADLSASLKIAASNNIPSKEGCNLSDFRGFAGIRGFSVTNNVRINSDISEVSFTMVNNMGEKFDVQISSSHSYTQAWKSFVIKTVLTPLHSSSTILFQRTSFDGIYAVMGYDPPGINYATAEGPFFVEISFDPGEIITIYDSLNSNLSITDKIERFNKQENNLAHVAREINSILKKEKQMLSKDSSLLKDNL